MPGVIAVVRDGRFLGVVAEREEQAIKAREALAASARSGSRAASCPIPRTPLRASASRCRRKDAVISDKKAHGARPARRDARGDLHQALHGARARSARPCAVAEFSDGKLTVWTPCQGVFPLRADLAKALKMPPAAIRCIHVEGAGCYGHNGADDVALDAALLARAVPGRPVRVQWMRDDEFAWEPYGPAMVMQAQGRARRDGRIVDWQYEVWSNTPPHAAGVDRPAPTCWRAGISPSRRRMGAARQPAAAGRRRRPQRDPALRFPEPAGGAPLHPGDADPRLGAAHARRLRQRVRVESFMDELAAAAGADPVAFRLAHMKDPRARAVIETVAAMADWKPGEKGDGTRGRGIGFSKYKNLACYVACVAEVEVDRAQRQGARAARLGGDRRRPRHQSGRADQPDRGRHHPVGELDAERGGAASTRTASLSRDWASYPILTMPDVPKVEVELINRPNERPLGAGEGSQGPAVAAIANAFAHATGKRLRDLPFTPERVKKALG